MSFRRVLLALTVALTALVGAAPAHAIVGGSNASGGQFPFMASIQDGDFAFCGGSVIAQRWVLTAAHCVPDGNPTGMSVVVGTNNNSDGSGRRVNVDHIEVHPNYDGDHDAALLHLAANANVTPIRLAGAGDNGLEADGEPVTVAGWGDQTPLIGGGLLTSSTLRSVDLNIVGDDECSAEGDSASELCAAALLKDSCQGDSGGPLFATTASGPVQLGIVSYGLGCAVPTQPGVYAEVNNTSIRSFITQHTGV